MKKPVFVVSALTLIACAGAVMAYSSSMGPTGGAGLPNADVVGQGKIELAYDLQNTHPEEHVETSSGNTRLLYGAAKDTEVGVVFASEKSRSFSVSAALDTWGVNVKKAFPEYRLFKPALGVTYSHSESNDASPYNNDGHAYSFDLYGVASKVFQLVPNKLTLTGSFGIKYSQFHAQDSFGFHGDSITRPYIIADIGLNGGATFTAETQFSGINSISHALSTFALHYPLTKNVSFKAATKSYEHQPSFGLDYSFAK